MNAETQGRRAHRDTISLEPARVLSHEHHDGGQRVLRLAAPATAAAAAPGQFVHLRCDARLDMRRPLSIMRADPDAGWIELLYKQVGAGTSALGERRPGDELSLLGPIGVPFAVRTERPRPLLLGGGVGMPPMVFLAERLSGGSSHRPFVILGSEVPFPFTARPSRKVVRGMPAGVVASMPLLEEMGITSRLATGQGYPGCHDGHVTDLARHWLDAMDPAERMEVEVLACGPTPMLRAAVDLAADYGLDCQACLEEYMACAVGGCAGCAVRVRTADGVAMKRVCVDGPVFDGHAVLWDPDTGHVTGPPST